MVLYRLGASEETLKKVHFWESEVGKHSELFFKKRNSSCYIFGNL